MIKQFTYAGKRCLAVALPVEATDGYEMRTGSKPPVLSFFGCCPAVELPEGNWQIRGLLFPDLTTTPLWDIFEAARFQTAYLAAGGTEDYNSVLLIER